MPHVCRCCDCQDVTGVSFHKLGWKKEKSLIELREFHPKWEFHAKSFTDQCDRLVGRKCSTGFLGTVLAVETCSGANLPTPRQPNPF